MIIREMSDEEWTGFRHFLCWLIHREDESKIEEVADRLNTSLEKYRPPFGMMLGALYLLVIRGTASQMLELGDEGFEALLKAYFTPDDRPSLRAYMNYLKDLDMLRDQDD